MDNLVNEHVDIASEIVRDLLDKFEQKSITSRSLIALSSIEAIAMITAMETKAHAKRNQLKQSQMEARIEKYCTVFTSLLNIEMHKLADA